jgi:large subunit ribosomal protein L23
MNRDPRQVILEPVVTEKSTHERQEKNQVAFVVARDATKVEIRHAVEKLFKVGVTAVRTMHVTGKVKRLGRFQGQRSSWKKAIVTLKEGQTIEFFEHT